MNLNTLTSELKQMLDSIFSICSSCALPDIIEHCILWQSELDSPLKIAIVGITSAGKSTLLNTLIKRNIVPTGAETLTYNVNVLRHVSKSPNGAECLIVHMKHGEDKQMPISELSRLVDGRIAETELLRKQIYWVEAFVDYDYLKEIDLIDTPGLLSLKEDDSKNTISLFDDEERRPDVFIYLMQRTVQEKDIEAVKSFQSALGSKSKISGLNTVAAITHCDYFCKGDYSIDFHAKAKSLIEDNKEHYVSFRSCFSKTFTLAAIYAQAAYCIGKEDFAIIKALKDRVYDEIIDNIYTKNNFIENDEVFGEFISKRDERREFVNRIDMSVIKYCMWWLKNNPETALNDLRSRLIEMSGVPELDEYVFTNFKRLAIYFKSLRLVTNLRKYVEKSLASYIDSTRISSIEKILILCRNFEVRLLSHFSFLSVLIDYYNGDTYFSKDEWEIALEAIDECLSDLPNEAGLNEKKSFFIGRKRYYSMLSDIEAIEACDKLINQIQLTI